MKETEIKGIIPDVPVQAGESRIEITKSSEEQKKVSAEEKPAAPSAPARVRSRWFGGIAAVLALAVTAGGVLAYLGGAKNIGPLASVMHGAESLPESSDAVPDSYTDDMHAKLVFTTFSGFCADMISDGKASNIPAGTFTYDLSDISEAEPAVFRGMLEQLVTDERLTGQIAFRISSAHKPLWAQWRAGDGTYVAQYPEPGEGLTFGENKNDVPEIEGMISATLIHCQAELCTDEKRIVNTGSVAIDEALAAKAVEEYQQTNMTVTPDESKPKLYGLLYSIMFQYDGKSYEIGRSDRTDAPIIINGEYCSCPAAEELLDKYGNRKAEGYAHSSATWLSADMENGFSINNFPLSTEYEQKVIKWYEDFLAAKYQPVEDVGTEIAAGDTKYIELIFNGRTVIIVNTKYTGTNVQVNGKYYNVPGDSVFDGLEEEYKASRKEFPEIIEELNKDAQAQ
ncbi:MAG: hypothetical protein IJR91_03890 [Ruminococcus sp.]|nr:hypothetical protein [Ruminococcus sp.]